MATAMTTARATTEDLSARARRHWFIAAAVAAMVLSLIGYVDRSASALAVAALARQHAVLADPRQPMAISTQQIRTALAAEPLHQPVVNVAMVRAVRSGAPAAPWLSQVSRLGWRDTVALQNELYAAAREADVTAILTIGDALLRRQSFTEQIVPAFTMFELDPTLRQRLVGLLASAPDWRATYLGMTGNLQRPDQLRARFETLRALQARGVKLSWSAVAQNIRLLDAGGMSGDAFALWTMLRPGESRPLGDPRFAFAGANDLADDLPTPFEWQTMSGAGFDAGISDYGGQAVLEIDWNGRGVPLFAQQRTSGAPGNYVLKVGVTPAEARELSLLTFRLSCGGQTSDFRQQGGDPTRLVTEQAVTCDYPMFEIHGAVQASAMPHQLTISSLTLRRTAPGT